MFFPHRPGLTALALTIACTAHASAELVHRWSFDQPAGNAPLGTAVPDSISGATATIRGNGSDFTGTAIRLPGNTTGNQPAESIAGYVDLPNGIISSKEDLTIEIWATPLGASPWSRVFDFNRASGPGTGEITDQPGVAPGGTTPQDNLMMSFTRGNDLDLQRLRAIHNGNDNPIDTALPTDPGTRYHYACTFEQGVGAFGDEGGRVSWYRDGGLVFELDVDFQLSDLEDVNNWLGRSAYSGDGMANASYDELRIHDHAFEFGEVAASLATGPDELPGPYEPVEPPVADHLWTFTVQADSEAGGGTTFPDELGDLEATLRGNGGALDGRRLILPGSTNGNQPGHAISAYLDLPNGIASASPSVTFEAWATPLSARNWQRLFDFGRAAETHGTGAEPGEILDNSSTPGPYVAYDNLSLTFSEGGNLDSQQLEGQFDGNPPQFSFSTAATEPGQAYHYVLVVEDGVGTYGATGCRASWFRDGILQNSDDFPFRMTDMEDVNNWIGRSMYGGDSNSHMSLDEFRVYRRALSFPEVLASRNAGPDPDSGPPEPPAPAPVPVHRWTFNSAPGNAPDGTLFLADGEDATATLRGERATLDGNHLVLPQSPTDSGTDGGSISAYLDLPNGFVSSHPSLSFEAWITPLSSNNWQRIFDFGSTTTTHGPGAESGEIVDDAEDPGNYNSADNLFLSLNNSGSLGSHRLAGRLGGNAEDGINIDLSGDTEPGTEYHYVLSIEDDQSGGSVARAYRDGTLIASLTLPFRPTDLNDVNNWIGRSMYSADSNTHMAINELRVYDRAITRAEIASSLDAGPDTDFLPPTTVADAATIHAGQKVLLDVLANDSGSPDPATLEIIAAPSQGSASVTADGKVLYTHDGGSADSVSFSYRVGSFGGFSEPATVGITISDSLRIDNPSLAMPPSLPPTQWALVDALPGLSFDEPICLASIPGDPQRLFVAERLASIHLVPDVTAPAPTAQQFLDLQDVVAGRSPSETIQNWSLGENGLLGMAFHPDFASNGTFFVAYTVRIDNGAFGNGAYFQRVSRFTTMPGNPDLGDPGSEVILLQQQDDSFNHNGGDIHFGPDGYLYYAAGDEDNSPIGQRNSQLINLDFFCGVFRLDVDLEPEDHTENDGTGSDDDSLPPNPHPAVILHDGNPAFEVPIDNPFVHSSLGGEWDGTYQGETITPLNEIRTEFWATGLRHTWRMSFDSLTGDLWGGDVGQVTYEEVNKIEKGVDYGWAYREGAHDFDTVIGDPPPGFESTDPFYEYVHGGVPGGSEGFTGNSVCGGYVYRGTRYPELEGYYVFCDSVSGHVWRMDTTDGSIERITGLPGEYGVFSSQGVDPSNQDLLFCAYNDGRILRLARTTDDSYPFPQTLSETGLFSDLSDLSPAPGLLPMAPNLRFWSDHADKLRWFAIPDPDARMTWKREGAWEYPPGMLWVKHFDLPTTRGNPDISKRLETRVLVQGDGEVYGVSYEWNDAGTEAFLVDDGGSDFPVDIDDGGSPHTQHWQIPSRSSCLTCHGDQPLSFNTRQLNREVNMNGFLGNQIDLLHLGGFLDNDPDPVAGLPFHVRPDQGEYPLEQRVRSYLDVNCAYCHQDGGSVSGFWDGREALTLEQTGLILGDPADGGGDPANKYVVPGDPLHSVVLSRVSATNGFTRMPPLATSELDHEAIDLLTEWIQSGLPADRTYDGWVQTHHPGLGARDADDDGDGRSNGDEFLLGSDPFSGGDAPPASISGNELRFARQPFRIYQIERSSSLADWIRWDVPENTPGYGTTEVLEAIPLPLDTEPASFFRLRVSEP